MRIKSDQYYSTLIIGTGCAGYNAADWLYELGKKDIAIITEGINVGTSRNAGSDKQTYYKLSLTTGGDSTVEMAQDLFKGGAMHGDTALVEAACSVKAFMKLALLGVPFPTNKYGEYIGYKTDHDPRQRATSAGPLTSRLMTETLEKSVAKKEITVIDNMQVVRILADNNKITGLVAVNIQSCEHKAFACDNIILATGGTAGVYYHSVYPKNQTGATGLAINAGAKMQNLCEWQYGLSSVKFRWNVSGTYQQVLPKYISIGTDGIEREFLQDKFDTPFEAMDMIFLKGYQWPFDVRKLNGSSRIDILVNNEIQNGRRVFMDFRDNPTGLTGNFESLSKETYQYLEKSETLGQTPILRLEKMNPLAIKLYKDNGIDLYNEPLEIGVCAQHCNGGVAVDTSWESSIRGLYSVGEAAGTHGIYRPGGSALNSAQVGAMRAAEHISNKKSGAYRSIAADIEDIQFAEYSNVEEKQLYTQKSMSACASFIRNPNTLRTLLEEMLQMKDNFYNDIRITSSSEIPAFYKLYDALTTQISMLSAMILSAEAFGSRGSALVYDIAKNDRPDLAVITDDSKSYTEAVRAVPAGGGWFETVWNDFNSRRMSKK